MLRHFAAFSLYQNNFGSDSQRYEDEAYSAFQVQKSLWQGAALQVWNLLMSR